VRRAGLGRAISGGLILKVCLGQLLRGREFGSRF
jgi:hypothetical protein